MNPKLKPGRDEFAEYGSLLYTEPKMPIVYGPKLSRRFGLAAGINLLGDDMKVCSFDCPYCDLGATTMRLNRLKTEARFPSLEEIDTAMQTEFLKMHQSTDAIKTIVVSGNGEPTLHPLFPEAIPLILHARTQNLPNVPVVVLTNGANLDLRKIVDALNKVDERVIKVDAGNDILMKAINSPLVRTSVSRIISNVRQLKDCIVQSFFVHGVLDNTRAPDIEEWIEVIGLIKPKTVHIHGMNRVPAARGLKPADEDTLYSIAQKLERRTQIRSLVFP